MNDTIKKIRKKSSLAWMDEPIKSDKWTNIVFFKDGRSFQDPYTYPTEKEARDKIEGSIRKIMADASDLFKMDKYGMNDVPKNLISHHIQVPVK